VVTKLLGAPDSGKDDAAVVVAKVCSQMVLSSTASFELYGWVDVSNSSTPFDVGGFCQVLQSRLRANSTYSTDPVGECSNLLRERLCLVVIYGLQSIKDCLALESAGLINTSSHSCIVVVTTEKSVAEYWPKTKEGATPAAVCNDDIEPIAHVESLSGQQQVCLLCSSVHTYIHNTPSSIRFHDTTSACRSYLA
jgi:hypothetical protein